MNIKKPTSGPPLSSYDNWKCTNDAVHHPRNKLKRINVSAPSRFSVVVGGGGERKKEGGREKEREEGGKKLGNVIG